MAKLTYAIEQNGLKHLELTYKGFVYDGSYITVTLDGKELGAVADKVALKAGQEFLLEDGSMVTVCETKRNGIQVSYNGKVQTCFAQQRDTALHQNSYVATFFIGGYTLLLATTALALGPLKLMSPFILYWLITGSSFLVLGHFVKKASALALVTALVYYAVDVVSLFFLPSKEYYWIAGALTIHLSLMVRLYAGIGAILRLKIKEAKLQ